jgi:hypothetical protein
MVPPTARSAILTQAIPSIYFLHIRDDKSSCPLNKGSLIMNLSSRIKPFAWGAVSGAVLWWIVLAFGFGWMSHGTAQRYAAQQSDDAVVAALAPVCAEKFMAQPNAAIKKAALAEASSWSRRDAFEKEWVTLPGGYSPDIDLVNACSDLVLKSSKASKPS